MNQLALGVVGRVFGLFFLLWSAVGMADELVINAEDFDTSAYKGKVLYLDFWASWCGPCRATFPLMNELQQKYGQDQLTIIAVNLDGKRADADQFLKSYPAEFSILYDPEGVLASRYQLPGMPTSYIYDQQGDLALTHIGFRANDADLLRTKLASMLDLEHAASH